LAFRLKHQLSIHLDYGPVLENLELRYSYPFSAPHELPEQSIRMGLDRLDGRVRQNLDFLIDSLTGRTKSPDPVHLPHTQLTPVLRPTILTVVIQDQTRQDQLPIMRLYLFESVDEVGSRIERETRVEGPSASAAERDAWQKLRQWVKGRVWDDYLQRLGSARS